MMKGAFNPAKDIPSFASKVILITGGNDGVGKQTALDLARHEPEQIWIAARTAEKSQAAIDEIRRVAPRVDTRFLKLDLSDFESVKAAARTFLASSSRLDSLILNAGRMGGTPAVSPQGYEITLATNHMGHALLTKLLTPRLLETCKLPGADVRVVSLSSRGHTIGPGMVFDSFKTKDSKLVMIDLYCQSKLANVLFARSTAKHYPQFTSVAVNPGDIRTGLYDGGNLGPLMNVIVPFILPLMSLSVEDGAKNTLWAATSKEVKNGEYYDPIGASGGVSKQGRDDDLAEKFWVWTQKELEGYEI